MATKNDPRRSVPEPRRYNREATEPADWANATPALLHELICTVSSFGGAVRFGYTRDGGAYAIGILGDGEPFTEYIRPAENLDDRLLRLIEAYRA